MPSLKPAAKPSLDEFNQPLELLTEHQLKGYIVAIRQRREDLEWTLDDAKRKAKGNGGDIETRKNIQQASETWLQMMQFEVELQTRLAQCEAQMPLPSTANITQPKNRR